MARLVDKIEIELSAQDRRRIDRITKAVEALVKQNKSVTWVNHRNDPEAARFEELARETDRALHEFHRSAETGQFVSEEEADENPSTTVKEQR